MSPIVEPSAAYIKHKHVVFIVQYYCNVVNLVYELNYI